MLDIKVAAQSDTETVASIIRQSFTRQAQLLELTPASCPTYVAFESASGVQRRIESGAHVVLAFLGEAPIGTVSCVLRADSDHGEIMRLAVLPQHRGHGYGKRLMAYAEQYLRTNGAAVLELSIVAQFERLLTYYEGLGYSTSDQKGRVSGLPFDLLFLVKRLHQPSKGANPS
jgi:GNAT superfamily N-acetyltransferase